MIMLLLALVCLAVAVLVRRASLKHVQAADAGDVEARTVPMILAPVLGALLLMGGLALVLGVL
jgi:uncharacterized membrane protein SirB2